MLLSFKKEESSFLTLLKNLLFLKKKKQKDFTYWARNMLKDLAPAKINLNLLVTGKRHDGYHLLDSLVVFAGVHDTLTATPSDTITLTISGPFGENLAATGENLVLRAARALAAATGGTAGAALHLTKNLPLASGIGGGSADAAATLRLLQRLWSTSLPPGTLLPLATTLGADVPVCLTSTPRRMAGIGDILSPAPALPAYGLVLINPGVPVSTADIFRARPAISPPAAWPRAWPSAAAMAACLAASANNLEPPALSLCPPIGAVLQALRAHPACLLARMSGSGATCFGLFPTPAEATQAARALARPGWWCWGGAPHPLYGAAITT